MALTFLRQDINISWTRALSLAQWSVLSPVTLVTNVQLVGSVTRGRARERWEMRGTWLTHPRGEGYKLVSHIGNFLHPRSPGLGDVVAGESTDALGATYLVSMATT